MKKKIVFFTGAGISQESGIRTFRDAGGLWEGYDIHEVASIEGWNRNPALVLDFYNLRRKELLSVIPNKAHYLVAKFEKYFDVQVITQNVDDLHERSGSSNVLHLHGQLLKSRYVHNSQKIFDCLSDINLGDIDRQGNQLRPHIVWFGESVPELETAIKIVKETDYFVVVGTSLQVYPAANVLDYVSPIVPFYFIDPNPEISIQDLNFISKSHFRNIASEGIQKLFDVLC